MKFMQIYGSPFPSYEGAVVVEDKDTSQEKARGYFEAVQAPDGEITIGCFFPGGAWECAENDIRNHNLRYHARDGGWSLQTEGGIFILSERCYKFMYEVVIKVTRMRAKQPSHRENPDYDSLRFAIANLVLGGITGNQTPRPITFNFQNIPLTVKPVEDYLGRVRRLQAVGGIEHTVDVEIKLPHSARKSLDESVDLMTDLTSILRLWSGNKLNWLYGEGYTYGGNPSEVLHQSPILGDYSNTVLFFGLSVSLCELTKTVPIPQERALNARNIREHIDGFVDSCKTGQSWETSAIAAATLLDALAAQYAVIQGKSEILSEDCFNRKVLPALESVIKSIKLQKDVKDQLKSKFQGMYRTSMRRKVKFLSDELQLCMNSKLRGRVVDVRNELVHKGRFPDRARSQSDCNLLLWMDFAILCRLVGYEGELPPPPTTE